MSSSSSPASEVAHHGASDHCLNCATLLAPGDKFCRACGQDTANHPPTLFEFVHEFVAHYVALEGALWRSLKGLAFRPGFLTVEYLAGRKARYVLPLRLLLTLGFIFFLAINWIPGAEVEFTKASEQESHASAPASSPPRVAAAARSTVRMGPLSAKTVDEEELDTQSEPPMEGLWVQGRDMPAWLATQWGSAEARWKKDPQAEFDRIRNKVRSLMPYAVLCSLPFFAGILALVFWRRRLTYGAHFVFAMHLHAFFYLALMMLLIPITAVEWAVFGWLVLYPLLAIKRVYAPTWRAALGRGALVFVLHSTLQVLMLITVFAIGALSP